MTALLTISDLRAGYQRVPVVHGISLDVHSGEVVALLGPNGAGKTTTLLTVSGLLPALAGKVSVMGTPANPHRPHIAPRRGLAHVPEDRSLFFNLTVAENLRLGVRTRERRKAIAGIFDYFPALEPLMERRAGVLSGGEQQMLAMARALVSRPQLLLVDEMSLGLAPVIVQRLLPVLRLIARRDGTGVLFVEQHVNLALAVADRAYVLTRGEIRLEGKASALAEQPEVLQASYLGEGGR